MGLQGDSWICDDKCPSISSKPKGPGEKGAPTNHQQKLHLRNWPISSADFSMTPMEGQLLPFLLLRRRILGQYPAAPCSPGHFVLLLIQEGCCWHGDQQNAHLFEDAVAQLREEKPSVEAKGVKRPALPLGMNRTTAEMIRLL